MRHSPCGHYVRRYYFCTTRRRMCRWRPSWITAIRQRQRLKAEELLAQQLSQLQSRRARAHLRAPVLAMVSAQAFASSAEPEQPEMLPCTPSCWPNCRSA